MKKYKVTYYFNNGYSVADEVEENVDIKDILDLIAKGEPFFIINEKGCQIVNAKNVNYVKITKIKEK